MMKKYEGFMKFEDTHIKVGDRVIVKYKDCPYYMKTGKIVSIIISGMLKGDCDVLMDFDNKILDFSYINLIKIEELVEVPSGEIKCIEFEDAIELAMAGAIRWNDSGRFYYFDDEDKWQIENYEI